MKTSKGCLDHILLKEEKPSKEELLKRFGGKKAKPFKKGEEAPEKDEKTEKEDDEEESDEKESEDED